MEGEVARSAAGGDGGVRAGWWIHGGRGGGDAAAEDAVEAEVAEEDEVAVGREGGAVTARDGRALQGVEAGVLEHGDGFAERAGGIDLVAGEAAAAVVGDDDGVAVWTDGDVAGGAAVGRALIDEGELAGGGIDVPAADGAAWVLGGAVLIDGDEEFPVRSQGEEAGAGGGAGQYGRPEGAGFRIPIGRVNALAGRAVVGAEVDAGFRQRCAVGGEGEQGASGSDGGDRDGGKP